MHNTAQHSTEHTQHTHNIAQHTTAQNGTHAGRPHTEHTTQTTHKTHTKQAHTEHTTNTPHTPREHTHTHNPVTQARTHTHTHTHTHTFSLGMFGVRRTGLPHEIGSTEFKKSASGGQMCSEHTQNGVAIRYSLAG